MINILMGTLTACPATDVNYKPSLERATNEQLEEALEIMKNRVGNKSRITTIERELRRRAKDESNKNNN